MCLARQWVDALTQYKDDGAIYSCILSILRTIYLYGCWELSACNYLKYSLCGRYSTVLISRNKVYVVPLFAGCWGLAMSLGLHSPPQGCMFAWPSQGEVPSVVTKGAIIK